MEKKFLKKILINCNIELICLAGYMKMIPEKIINHLISEAKKVYIK